MVTSHALLDATLVAAIALASRCYAAAAQVQTPSEQAGVSDQEIRAFAKAYVEFHRVRQAYEPALKNAQDPKEKRKLEQEANSKIEKALERHGLTVQKYNRIFAAANRNEALRKKALGLIGKERQRS